MSQMKRINWRIFTLGLCFVLLFTLLGVRVWWVQTVDAPWIMGMAKEQWERDNIIAPKRGSILDRNGAALAYEGKAYTVSAYLRPSKEEDAELVVKDPYYTASKLAPILKMKEQELLEQLTRPKGNWVDIGKPGRNKFSEEQKNAILALQFPKNEKGEPSEENRLPGIYLKDTTKRVYPNNSFASHVLGYITYDNKTNMGLEAQFDEELRGLPGELQMMRDAAGYQLPQGEAEYKPARDGLNVVTTIDQQIQEYVEQALDKTESEYKPKKVTVIVSDPMTGEILAMGNRPQFNPNQYWDIENYENAAISYIFEPGSTFKIITLAAAIEEGLFNANEEYLSGSYRKLKGSPIKDHNNGHGWGNITFLEGVQRSSNVAFVILGYERLKQELLGKYFKDFGIGQLTGIQLPGERKGIMRDLSKAVAQRDVAVTTFGQGVAVTAIQQVAAIGAIANGGELLKPRIVKELRDPHTGAVVKRFDREVVKRVVSEKTAKQTREILETVVSSKHGTGWAYKSDSYQVAGKTGTAQKYDDKTGKIAEGQYVVSFIGFAPVDKPRLLIYVVVDDPQTNADSSRLGFLTVSPIFNSVMSKSLQYLQQKPQLKTADKVVASAPEIQPPAGEKTMPKLLGMPTSSAEKRVKQDGFKLTTIGTGTKITAQLPAPMEKVGTGAQVYLVTDRVAGTRMPDLRGKSLREVMEFASLLQIDVAPTGSGFVNTQSIPPGTTLKGKERLQITLTPGASP